LFDVSCRIYSTVVSKQAAPNNEIRRLKKGKRNKFEPEKKILTFPALVM
jgi:hypothetical protein